MSLGALLIACPHKPEGSRPFAHRNSSPLSWPGAAEKHLTVYATQRDAAEGT